jgi:hypothetical protein
VKIKAMISRILLGSSGLVLRRASVGIARAFHAGFFCSQYSPRMFSTSVQRSDTEPNVRQVPRVVKSEEYEQRTLAAVRDFLKQREAEVSQPIVVYYLFISAKFSFSSLWN